MNQQNRDYFEDIVDDNPALQEMPWKRLPRDHPGSRWPRPERDWDVEHEMVRQVSTQRLLRLRRAWDNYEAQQAAEGADKETDQ